MSRQKGPFNLEFPLLHGKTRSLNKENHLLAHRLEDIARELGATLTGDGSLTVTRLVHPKDARGPGDLLVAFDPSLHATLDSTPAVCAVLGVEQEALAARFKGAVLVPRPRAAMAKLTALFVRPLTVTPGAHPSSLVDASARLGKDVAIGPLCVIGPGAVLDDGVMLESQVTVGEGARIGAESFLHAGVRIGPGVTIGARAVLHYNAVIGADGFSFTTRETGSVDKAREGVSRIDAANTTLLRIHSLGAVSLGDDVEIGACTTIDRGTVTDTQIGNGAKIDNHVQIGHNAVIGGNALICGMAGVAGSAVLGARVVLGARAGVADHVRVGDDAVLGAGAQAGSHLAANGVYLGTPAMPRERALEQFFHVSRLKILNKRLEIAETKINLLEHPDKKG